MDSPPTPRPSSRNWIHSLRGWLDRCFPVVASTGNFAFPVQASGGETLHADRPRVLLVDDNPGIQQSTCDLLRRWGIVPMLAADGAEAVALACAHRYDLILMDLQMPVLDGLAATKQIRQFEQEHGLPRVPVIAHTSAAFCLPGRLLPISGVDAVLRKPCDAPEL